MPIVSVKKETLLQELGIPHYTDDDFSLLCFEFGIELDEVTSEREEMEKQHLTTQKSFTHLSDEITYKIDIPANRYDLLCLEGIVLGIKVFMGKDSPKVYKAIAPASGKLQQTFVKESVSQVRPHVLCAILRDITFTDESLKSFMQLQDKLHQNICRERSLVSIGTHDLDTVSGPFSYEGRQPTAINFVPLEFEQEFNAKDLLEHYKESGNKLRKYTHLIEDKPVYPLFLDSTDTVMSLPPIINSNHSKITLDTKNVFIECTAIDITKCRVVLDQVVCLFSQYCAQPFTYEQVEVVYPDNTVEVHQVKSRTTSVNIDYINNKIGVELGSEEIVANLNKMCLKALVMNDKEIQVVVPATRADVLHPIDIVEDVAIAYGYNNLIKTVPNTQTVGEQLPINKITDLLRIECAMAGFTEALSFSLCSHDEYFKYMKKEDKGDVAVVLANPATVMFQIVRPSLMPGIMKTVAANRKYPKPLMVFEISDIVVKDPSIDVGTRNQRNLCLMYMGINSSGFEIVHGMLDRIMAMLKVPLLSSNTGEYGYYIKQSNDPMFFPGRQAEIYMNDSKLGVFGIIHPEVMEKFDLNCPCAILELNIQQFANYKSA